MDIFATKKEKIHAEARQQQDALQILRKLGVLTEKDIQTIIVAILDKRNKQLSAIKNAEELIEEVKVRKRDREIERLSKENNV